MLHTLKINILLTVFLLMGTSPLIAAEKSFEIGFRGGIGASSIARKGQDNYKPQLAYSLGVSLSYRANDLFSFEINTLLNQRRVLTGQGSSITINYLALPVMVKADPLNLGVFFTAGIQFNFLMKASADDRFGNSMDIFSDLNGLVYDVLLGIGYRSGLISIEIRYELGISDLIKDESSFGAETERNSSILLVIGANFDL
ncbi:MAG: hypothetical protein IEMM0008_1131 [bacterium]|nr:MAG: hypothetical protein IEMM0008_1131 [bacterium]